MKKLLSMLLSCAVMLVSQTGCGARNSSSSSKKNGGDNMIDSVKLLGRTYAAQDGKIWMGLSGTGVELEYSGKKLSVTLRGDCSDTDKMPRIGVYVDGERKHDICVPDVEKTVDIEGKGDTSVSVKIIKLSECLCSCCAITSMDAHGGKIEKTASKQRRIEFIGDSITCGYGVDDTNLYHGFSSVTEDCTKAYAIKTAQILNADHSLVSFSGYGIVSGFTPDGIADESKLVPTYYEKYGSTENNGFGRTNPSDIQWDFSSFKPDVIVVFLGTNDISYTGYDAQRQKEYTECYVRFLENVRSNNPEAKIVCTLGTMGTALNGAMNEAVSQYSAKSGDKNICSFDLPLMDVEADGCVIQSHPSEITHNKIAQLLSDKIRTEMNWK